MKLISVILIVLAIGLASGADINPNRRRQNQRTGKRVVKRPRGGRQLFGTRVVVPASAAPLPLVRTPVLASPVPVIQRASIIPSPAPVAAPVPVPIPAPVPAPLPAARTVQLVNVALPKTSSLEEPIAITRSVYNAPGTQADLDAWNYAFETENGIKQEAVGTMKTVGDAQVMVMEGSYEYIGTDGAVYIVDWVADERGFRASAPHLPKAVPIPFPEQRAAVEAQLRLAAEEENLAASASSSYGVPAVPAPVPVQVVEPTVIEVRANPQPSNTVEVKAPLSSYTSLSDYGY